MNIQTELYEKLAKLQWLLQRRQFKTHAAVGPMADTTRGQGRILAFLRMKDGISTKDLSYMLDIRISSLNELLAKLEKAEYITRKPSEADKRIMEIYLTPKGKEEEDPEVDSSHIFSRLSPEEQVIFGDYLVRIITVLEEELGTDADRDVTAVWMETARERLGAEEFDKLMAMREQMWGNLADGRFGGRFPGMGGDGRGPNPGPGMHGAGPGPGFGPGMHGFGRPTRAGHPSPPPGSRNPNDPPTES